MQSDWVCLHFVLSRIRADVRRRSQHDFLMISVFLNGFTRIFFLIDMPLCIPT